MRRILRSPFLLNSLQTSRGGGHGWPRPDVPLSFNHTYVHKREVKRKKKNTKPKRVCSRTIMISFKKIDNKNNDINSFLLLFFNIGSVSLNYLCMKENQTEALSFCFYSQEICSSL